MSRCFGCFFHRGGYMENECVYFEAYNYREPSVRDGCPAFSISGNLSKEAKAKIFDITDGVFGEPRDSEQENKMRAKYIKKEKE